MDKSHLLLDSLLYHDNGDLPSFDVLFSEFLLENTNIRYYDSSFFVHIFLGLATVLSTKQGRLRYKVDRSFFAWYQEFNMVKLITLTKDKRMRVRNFYLEKIENDMPRFLTKSEFEQLGLLTNGYELKNWVHDIYKDEMKLGKIDPFTTYAGFLSKYMVDMEYGVHDKKVVDDYLKSQREALAGYDLDVQEYVLERSKTGSGRLFTVKEVYSEDSMLRNTKLLGVPWKPNLMDIETEQINFQYNTLALLDGMNFALGEKWSDELGQAFDKLYIQGHQGNQEAFMTSLEQESQIYTLVTQILGYPADKSEAREGGFTLGLLLGLNGLNPTISQFRLTQYIPAGGFDNEFEELASYFIVLEPLDVLEQQQILLSFSTEMLMLQALEECKMKRSVHHSYLLFSIDLLDNDCTTSLESMPNRGTFVSYMFAMAKYSLDSSLVVQLDSIQPPTLLYEEKSINYLSRFFLGFFASINEHGFEIHEMRAKADTGGQSSVSYLMKSPNDKYIVINFLDTRGRFYPRTCANCDTNIVNIVQERIKDNDGYIKIKRTVEVQRSNFEMISNGYDFKKIESFSTEMVTTSPTLFTERLTAFMQTFKHLIDSTASFEALLDGLFDTIPYTKNVLPLKRRLSTAQYTLRQNAKGIEEDGKSMDESREMFLTVNFKFNDEEESVDKGLEAMLEMMSSAREDHEYLNIVIDNGDNIRSTLLTQDDVMKQCNTVRKKRHSLRGCIDIFKKQKELEHGNEIPEKSMEQIAALEDVAAFANFIMMGFMLRDLIADAAHGKYGALLKDSTFLAATALSPKLAEILEEKGDLLLSEGARLSGYATKTLSSGIGRAITLYILEDFVSNAVKYARNGNDSSAEVGIAVDGAFLTIDAVTIGIESLASASVAAVATPVGAIIGTAIIIGLNVYQSIQEVEHISNIIKLDEQETFEQSMRALLHLNPAKHIEHLVDEKLANTEILKSGLSWLVAQEEYDTIVLRSGELKDQRIKLSATSFIDFRKESTIEISRASPENIQGYSIICPLHLGKDEQSSGGWWNKVSKFFTDASLFVNIFERYFTGHEIEALETVAHHRKDSCQRIRSYECHSAFAVQKRDARPNRSTLFKLGPGNDTVHGFRRRKNVFYIDEGLKNIKGGDLDDKFILQSPNVYGTLDAGAGFDTLDMSMCSGTVWPIKATSLAFKNFEEFIFARNARDSVNCSCSMKRVDTRGGNFSHPDSILVSRSELCIYNITFILRGFTTLDNQAESGNFTYLVDVAKEADITIKLSKADHMIHVAASLLDLKDVNISSTTINLQFGTKIRIDTDPGVNFRIIFTDGCTMLINNSIPMMTLNTTATLEDVMKIYSEKIEELSILFIVYSSSDKKSMTFTHGSENNHLHVIHNNLEYESKLVLNPGSKNLLLMNGSLDSGVLKFPDISLHCHDATLTVDFNLLIQHMPNTSLYLNANTHENYLIVTAFEEDQDGVVVNSIGQILLNETYKQVKFQSYSKLDIQTIHWKQNFDAIAKNISLSTNTLKLYDPVKRYLENMLEPEVIIYSQNYNLIFVSQTNVEWFQILHINSSVDHLQFYHVNHKSLILTNAATVPSYDIENLCTIVIENFYHWLKLQTIIIRSKYKEWNLMLRTDEIKSAQSIDTFIELSKQCD